MSNTGVWSYEVVLSDGTVHAVAGADGYEQEGPLTTFFASGSERRVLDSWSTRLASFRTADVRLVRRCRATDGAAPLTLAS